MRHLRCVKNIGGVLGVEEAAPDGRLNLYGCAVCRRLCEDLSQRADAVVRVRTAANGFGDKPFARVSREQARGGNVRTRSAGLRESEGRTFLSSPPNRNRDRNRDPIAPPILISTVSPSSSMGKMRIKIAKVANPF
jgi:hypothetical protein